MGESVSCARPTGASVGEKPIQEDRSTGDEKESKMDIAQVGRKAPDFKAPAFYQGEFTEVQLEDYLGEWLLLCFYPGDFTLV
jgi:peroxiredoxin (alkyl hydroperoxide reductase subunit C)